MNDLEIVFSMLDHPIKFNIMFHLKEYKNLTFDEIVTFFDVEKKLSARKIWELYNCHLLQKEMCGTIEKLSLTEKGEELIDILLALNKTHIID